MNTETIRFDVPLEKLNWKLKTYHFCKYAGYNYLSDFINKSVTHDIMQIRNLGKVNTDEIINSLIEHGYTINDDYICPPIKVMPDCKIYKFNCKTSNIINKLKGNVLNGTVYVIASSTDAANNILYEKYNIKNAIITGVYDIKEGVMFK